MMKGTPKLSATFQITCYSCRRSNRLHWTITMW